MIKAVVFDLGEVLSSPPSLMPTLAQRIGVSEAELNQHYWNGRQAYDGGSSDADYWLPLLGALGIDGDDALAVELGTLDSSIWVGIRASAEALLMDCQRAGHIVAVLSNAPRVMFDAVEGAPWRRYVDHLFVSGVLGHVKPEPETYHLVTGELGLEPSEIAFIDDKPANVQAAVDAGWAGHVWVDDADTRVWLQQIGALS